MILALGIFIIAYIFIATEWIDKTIAALIGAGLMIGLHLSNYEESLHAIDLNVIFLLVGMMIVVDILAETGVFEWLTIVIARLAKGNALVISIMFMLLTAVLSAFLDNVTTVILIAPITILLAQLLELPVVPLLIFEAIFSNIGGTATLVGDPPNILIGSQTHLSFNDFLITLGPPVIVILIFLIGLFIFLFRKEFLTTDRTRKRIEKSRPEKAIIKPKVLKRSAIIFSLILLGFFCGRFIEVEPGIIALTGAMIMALVCKKDIHKLLARVEWNTILFFVGLFMMVSVLEHHHVFEKMGQTILSISNGNLMKTVLMILWFSAFASAIVDNIPLVMAMIPLVRGIIPVFAQQQHITETLLIQTKIAEPLLWALALGACLGGNGTLVGASANVVIVQVAKRNKNPISFWNFTKYGLPFMVLSLIFAHIFLYVKYFIQ